MNDLDELNRILEEKSQVVVGSEMKRFQHIFPSLEKARAAGVKHKELWDELTRNGFKCSFFTYKNMWTRAKKKNKPVTVTVSPVSSAAHIKVVRPAVAENVAGDETLPSNEGTHSALVQRVRDGIPDPPKLQWIPGQKLGKDW